MSTLDRRQFVRGAAALGVAALAGRAQAAKPAGISVGYAALTWGDENARRAIAEISEVGYRGVQLRVPGLQKFERPAVLAEELARAKLTFACLSGGALNPGASGKDIGAIVAHAQFAKQAGALCLQVTGPTRLRQPFDLGLCKGLAASLTELGKRTSDLGLPLAFHPSANQLGGSSPAEVEAVLGASDPRHVKLLLDTGHHAAAGGDPAKAIKQHAGRLALLHLKDVRDQRVGDEPYEFVELGAGRVDFRAVFAALAAVKYAGWAVVEMRPYSVHEGHSARDGARANKAFLAKLGVAV
jgi:inosose dehydratase